MLYLVTVKMPTSSEYPGTRRELRTYTRRSRQAAARKADQLAERFGRRNVTTRPASQVERFPVVC